MIVRLRQSGAPLRGEGPVRMVAWRTLLGHIPDGPRRAAMAVIAYVLLNVGLSFTLGDEGVASVRLLSGNLLLFYLFSFMFFLFEDRRLRECGGGSVA